MARATANPLEYASDALRQRARDERDLNLLARLHNVWGWILHVYGIIFVFHLTIGVCGLAGRDPLGVARHYKSLDDAGRTLTIVGTIGVLAGSALGVLNRRSATAFRERRRRGLSLFAAVLNVINFAMCFPLPTILGAWTLAVLRRPTVLETYAYNATAAEQ